MNDRIFTAIIAALLAAGALGLIFMLSPDGSNTEPPVSVIQTVPSSVTPAQTEAVTESKTESGIIYIVPTMPTGAETSVQASSEPAATVTSATEATAPSRGPVRLEYGDGETYFDASPENKFITKISSERGIAAENLVSVYSLPDEGLNYVFEFDGGEKTFETLRRVYLIDVNGQIDSVAARDFSEAENVSSAENTLTMSVMIKRGLFPVIENLL